MVLCRYKGILRIDESDQDLEGDDVEELLSDLLSDLMHYARGAKLPSWETIEENARETFRMESGG